jgi:hypothetical protein
VAELVEHVAERPQILLAFVRQENPKIAFARSGHVGNQVLHFPRPAVTPAGWNLAP